MLDQELMDEYEATRGQAIIDIRDRSHDEAVANAESAGRMAHGLGLTHKALPYHTKVLVDAWLRGFDVVETSVKQEPKNGK